MVFRVDQSGGAVYKAWNLFSLSHTGVMDSNPTLGKNFFSFILGVCVALYR
jgi:hypothetical protein